MDRAVGPVFFQTTALAACGRSTVSDCVDLYIRITQHGFTLEDFAAACEAADAALQLDIVFNRLTSGQPRAGDPGVAGLMENPPAVEELAGFSREAIGEWKCIDAHRVLCI